ncbi:MAG: flagellar basal body-associated protein FliL [Alphaproteobacteria bacterium]
MKKLVIIIAALGLLGGGGFFAWTQFAGGDAASDHTEVRKRPDNPVYVEMEPLTVPFIKDGKFAQYVVLVVDLEVWSESDADIVRQRKPRLRDSFVTELHALAARRPPDQTLINLARVKARLLAGANEIMGSNVVRDVLVQLAH